MADEDFQNQLEMEALAKQREEDSAADNPYIHIDPKDGTVYEWNFAQQAWFPKVDDDFIAAYQANYQYQGESESKEDVPKEDSQEQKLAKRKPNDPCWFEVDDAHNTNVYVTGLPLCTTEEEFIELMSKCGLIMKDPDTMKYKIKLYRNNDGSLKGDGRCCYIKIESVDMALQILDGYYFKNTTITVERAQFQLKGSYDPTKKPKKKKSKDKEKLKKRMEKLFDWRPDKLRGMRSRNEKTVIIKNMFDPMEFDRDASLVLDYQKDVREECSKCGDVKKVVVYDRNPDGVVSVTFAEPEMADDCISLMNGRWFAARQLTAVTWDGKTKYKISETEQERDKRLKEWEEFLQGGSKKMEPPPVIKTGGYPKPKEKEGINYEMAEATDSSGDSDDEVSQQTTTSVAPVMHPGGSFTFSKSSSNESMND